MEILNQFYNDEFTREEVKGFLKKTLNEYALEKVYAKEETKHIAEAFKVIDDAFDEMGRLYGRQKVAEQVNKGR